MLLKSLWRHGVAVFARQQNVTPMGACSVLFVEPDRTRNVHTSRAVLQRDLLEVLRPEIPSKEPEVIIGNVPPLVNEDPHKVAETIFESLVGSLNEFEVLRAKRFESSRFGPKRFFIKVQLTTEDRRQQILAEVKRRKPTLRDLELTEKTGLSFDESSLEADFLSLPVRIEAAHSKETKALLEMVARMQKDKKIYAFWTNLDRVFIRKTRETEAMIVDCEDTLKKIMNT